MSLNLQWSFIAFVVVFCLSCYSVNPCFITNCPRGGKRNDNMRSVGKRDLLNVKECSRCGHHNTGRCFGPDLCCDPLTGCVQGTEAARICAREDQSGVPCRNVDVMNCGAVRGGQCVMQNYCCNSRGECSTDFNCHVPTRRREQVDEEETDVAAIQNYRTPLRKSHHDDDHNITRDEETAVWKALRSSLSRKLNRMMIPQSNNNNRVVEVEDLMSVMSPQEKEGGKTSHEIEDVFA